MQVFIWNKPTAVAIKLLIHATNDSVYESHFSNLYKIRKKNNNPNSYTVTEKLTIIL